MMAFASEEFIKYLEGGLAIRNWKQADLARKSGVSTGYISQILNGVRSPGVEFCKSIARAFGVPAENVLLIAGLIDAPSRGKSTKKQQIIEQMEQLDDEKIEALARYVQALTSETVLESIREPQTKPAKV